MSIDRVFEIRVLNTEVSEWALVVERGSKSSSKSELKLSENCNISLLTFKVSVEEKVTCRI